MWFASRRALAARAPLVATPWRGARGLAVCADILLERLGVTPEKAAKAEGKLLPNIRRDLTREHAEEVCDFLQSRLNLDGAELKKIVLGRPSLLSCSVDANLAPTIEYLQSRLSLSEAELKKIVLGSPPVLSFSIDNNLAPTIDWLKSKLSLSDTELKKIVLGNPSVLNYNVDASLAPKLSWLTSSLSLTKAELKRLVLRFPNVLSYSIDANLAPTIDFFEHELNIRGPDLRAAILASPQRLSYSLSNRYRPRLAACRAVGDNLRLVLTTAGHTDERFCERHGLTLEEYERLKPCSPIAGTRPETSHARIDQSRAE